MSDRIQQRAVGRLRELVPRYLLPVETVSSTDTLMLFRQNGETTMERSRVMLKSSGFLAASVNSLAEPAAVVGIDRYRGPCAPEEEAAAERPPINSLAFRSEL